MPSFYIDFNEVMTTFEVMGEEYHHIANVFRHKIGDILALTNGKGLIANASITAISKKSLTIKINDCHFTPQTSPKVACAFSLLKGKNDLLIVEKLTELGVQDLFPMQTEYSVKLSKENTITKMMSAAISAIKQCNNPYLPNIHTILGLEQALKIMREKGYKPLLASEKQPDKSLCELLASDDFSNKDICMIIGPEGGFSDKEFEFFDKDQIQQVTLHHNILRAETAAICAVSQAWAFSKM
ncbi:MAG: 16S rRNA (uracil(1498)-N(3))-methyltransferase [Candidatus Cloacimonetes bacterium]|nr:16S rRNA (uracil(1498)-N(3))-methyltransferase [Candidatus Cloacimonadota bacterium]